MFSKWIGLVPKATCATVCAFLSVTPAAAVKSVNAISIDGTPINGQRFDGIRVRETHVAGPRVASTPIPQTPTNQSNLQGTPINGVPFNAISNRWGFDHWKTRRNRNVGTRKPELQ
jgi:hypothetical protein